jgi:7-cyano-7-deazaguanine synthase
VVVTDDGTGSKRNHASPQFTCGTVAFYQLVRRPVELNNTIRTMPPDQIADVTRPLAVLVSGGVDSAVLLGEALGVRSAVTPIYVRTGARWETVEFEYLRRFLTALGQKNLRPLVELAVPVGDLYGEHWSITGEGVPGAETPDEAVYLPGRNVLLLSKALIWCHLNEVPDLALAPLTANPFPDATPAFFTAFCDAVNRAVAGQVHVLTPYLNLEKTDVLRRGRGLPLKHTFSCMRPRDGRHCGNCNKCAERKRAFIAVGISDPTEY